MRLLLVFLFACFFDFLSGQQIKLDGRISVFNSKYSTGKIQYIKDAFISSLNTKPSYSSDSGKFELEFVDIPVGMPVEVKVEKSGYDVVNAPDLYHVIVGQKIPLRVYVINKGSLALAQVELYKISKSALYERKDLIIAQLRAGEKEARQAMDTLESQFGQKLLDKEEAEKLLTRKVIELEKQLPEFAQHLASQNLDFASDLYIDAYEKLKKGLVEQAIRTLDIAKLELSITAAKKNFEEGKKLKDIGVELQEKAKLSLAQIVNCYELRANSFSLLFKYSQEIESYQKIINIVELDTADKLGHAYWYSKVGRAYYADGKYKLANECQLKALGIQQKKFGLGSKELAETYYYLAKTYYALADYDKSYEYNKKCIEIREKAYGINSLETALAYRNIANDFYKLNDNKRSLEYQEKCLKIQLELLSPDDKELAKTYIALSYTYKELKHPEKALEYQYKGLAIDEKHLQPNDPLLALDYMDIGSTHYMLEQYDKSLQYHEKAKIIFETVLNHNHPNLHASYGNISQTYRALGQYSKALEYQQKSIEITIKSFGSAHPDLSLAYWNMAEIYRYTNQTEEAIKYMRKSIEVLEKNKYVKPYELAFNYYLLGYFLGTVNKYQQSLDNYLRAISIIDKNLKEEKVLLANCYQGAGYAHQSLYSYKESLAFYSKSIQLLKPEPGFETAGLLYSYGGAVYACHALNENELALNYIKEAIAVRESNHWNPYDISNLALTYNALAFTYMRLKSYPNAIQAYQKMVGISAETKTADYYKNIGIAYAYNDQTLEAKIAFEAFEKLQPGTSEAFKNWAIFYALTNQSQKSLSNLRKAVDLGFSDLLWIKIDPSLKSIRKETAYKELVNDLEKR